MAALEARVEELQGVGIDLGTAAVVAVVVRECFFLIIVCPILRSHSISFTGTQGIPKYKIGLGRDSNGRVGVGLFGVTV